MKQQTHQCKDDNKAEYDRTRITCVPANEPPEQRHRLQTVHRKEVRNAQVTCPRAPVKERNARATIGRPNGMGKVLNHQPTGQ